MTLEKIFEMYQYEETPPVIILENIEHKTVGALFISKMRLDKIVISETNNAEKYFLLANGVGIYFSFWTKVTETELTNIKTV